MDNSGNKYASIQISKENLEKLKCVLDQLNIKFNQTVDTDDNIGIKNDDRNIDRNNDHNTDHNINQNTDKKNSQNEEDILDPLELDNINDVFDEPVNNQDMYDDNTNQMIDTNQMVDINEITPDDIIGESDHHEYNIDKQIDEEFDLASDEEEIATSNSTSNSISTSSYFTKQNINDMNNIIPQNRLNNKITTLLNNQKMETNHTLKESDEYKKPQIYKNREKISENKFTKTEMLKIENKITLNVGGKRFNIKKNLLEYLNINFGKLHKIIKDDGRIIYFLDRDPYYFSKIITLIKLYGFDQDKLLEHLDDYSEQLVNELCLYGLLDKKFNPRPKLRLKKMVAFSSKHDDIIKIIVGDQLFETSSGVLSRSSFFDTKIKISRSKQFYQNNIDPKIFRYVLNFLRTGELYINNTDILDLLDEYGIEYEKLESKRINENIISHYIPHSLDSVNNQISGCANDVPHTNDMLQIIDNKYYYPDNMLISMNVENFNIITSESKLLFGSEIVFNLTDVKHFLGDCIEDLLLCIDIPVLKPTEHIEYIDMIEYKLVEQIIIVIDNGINKNIICRRNNDLLYLYPLVYKGNKDYYEMTRIDGKKTKLLYDNNLIDIHRINLPLFFLKDKKNNLPIKKIADNNMLAYMIVKMAPLKKLFKNGIKDIPLLNVSLISNFIKFAPSIHSHQIVDKDHGYISNVPINVEHKMHPIMYLYECAQPMLIGIQNTSNPIFDVAIVPLDKLGFIKDFFFTIIEKNDFISDKIDKFADELIELEILEIQGKTLMLHSKMDSFLLNYYIPYKYLGHKLPPGIYYHSFSSDPKCNRILGGLLGNNYLLRIKVKKMDGYIKFYANEYVKFII